VGGPTNSWRCAAWLSFVVILADLDSFKNVNDSYGHDAGDLVLQKFSEVLRSTTRASDICGRMGGEEFVMVLLHVEEQCSFRQCVSTITNSSPPMRPQISDARVVERSTSENFCSTRSPASWP